MTDYFSTAIVAIVILASAGLVSLAIVRPHALVPPPPVQPDCVQSPKGDGYSFGVVADQGQLWTCDEYERDMPKQPDLVRCFRMLPCAK